MKIRDSRFLITGANRGIGLATARMAAKQGAHVLLGVRVRDVHLERELMALGAADVRTFVADLSTREGVEHLIQEVTPEGVDILFNNAGVLTGGLLEEQPLDEIYRLVQVNIAAVIHLTRGLLPGMLARRRGKIITNASVSSFMYFPCASTYAASKAAVMAFTSCLERELRPTPVTTLCLVTPGIKTRMFDEIEVKYAKNLETPKDTITPEAYAELIQGAIERDDTFLYPGGATGVGLWTAKHVPWLFKRAVDGKFKR